MFLIVLTLSNSCESKLYNVKFTFYGVASQASLSLIGVNYNKLLACTRCNR